MEITGNAERNQRPGELSLNTPGHSRHLTDIRTRVGALAREIGYSENEIAQIEMAVDEACSNVLRHAYSPGAKWCRPQQAPEIRVKVRVAEQWLIIEINDHGQSFDFAAHCRESIEQPLQAMRTGGYGIFIMRQFMDEVAYSSSPAIGNTVRLIKSLPPSVAMLD